MKDLYAVEGITLDAASLDRLTTYETIATRAWVSFAELVLVRAFDTVKETAKIRIAIINAEKLLNEHGVENIQRTFGPTLWKQCTKGKEGKILGMV